MSKEYEKLLQDLLNDEETNIAPESRLEAYLLALNEKIGGGGGGGGSGLPCVTITTFPTMDGVLLTEEETAAFSAVAETKMPIVVCMDLTSMGLDMVVSGVFSYMIQEGASLYSGTIVTDVGIMTVMFGEVESGVWMGMMMPSDM